ncbi:hypothetical protein Hanom_Chr11g00982091 [Helianthus anomalus]
MINLACLFDCLFGYLQLTVYLVFILVVFSSSNVTGQTSFLLLSLHSLNQFEWLHVRMDACFHWLRGLSLLVLKEGI